MTATSRKVGDIVGVNSPKFPGQWRIDKINAVNWNLSNVATGSKLRANPSFVIDDPGAPKPGEWTGAPRTPGVVVESAPVPVFVGSVVTVARSPKMGTGLYVVLAETGVAKYRLAKLGGDGGRYWRGIDGARLTVIDPSRISIREPE